ncbi:MAG: HlyD family efflux transporter periplasmic adaptor subunit [Synechococcaceae bacterium WB4_1_0192]|jgi:HlyD family secretion protein|nr:HlyD family efflux transporter periplasmic adaptor subunit [Synechococcaceae bacterium WB4_1_0192]
MRSLLSPGRLFRRAQNLLERSVASNHQDVVLQQSRTWVRSVTWLLVGATGFGLAWLSVAQTDEVVSAPGSLEPIGDVSVVQMPQGGVLQQMLVKEGERVSQGQVLLRLDSEASTDREKGLYQTISAKTQELTLKTQEMDRYLEGNSAEQQLATRNLGIDTNLLERLQKLQLTGAVSEVQVLSQRSQVNEGEAKLQTLKADRLRQSALFNQQIQALNGDLADLRSRLTESRVNNRYQLIRSPVNGVVFDLKPTGPGFVGQGSEPLMKIVPFNALKATVEVDSSKIGFVRTGQTVDISIDSFPSSDFGVVEGQIKRIGSDALPPDQLKQTYRFPVEVQLDSQQLRLKSGRALPLQVGMSLTANIKLRKVTYLQLMLSTFKDKTDSLREI